MTRINWLQIRRLYTKLSIVISLLAVVFIFSYSSMESKHPMTVDYENSADARWRSKNVLESKIIDSMEIIGKWKAEGYADLVLTDDNCYTGKRSFRMITPVNSRDFKTTPGVGAFGEGRIIHPFNNEDWSAYNRIVYWVYPHSEGFGPVHILTKLYNHGDAWNQRTDGLAMNFTELVPNQWNQVIWEIEDLQRDQVTQLSLIFVMRGKPFKSGPDTLTFDFDQLELHQVKPDYVEGWEVAPGRIAFSHTGYLPNGIKKAFSSSINSDKFYLYNGENDGSVYEGDIIQSNTDIGKFQIIDFTEFSTPGTYYIKAGDITTRSFKIGDNLWEPSVEKVLNFFYCERCGMPVEDIHSKCHEEFYFEKDGKRIRLDGGWHDAADLTKKGENPEGIYGMLKLAHHLNKQGRNEPLMNKLLDEAIWGLDWLMKVRFEDGTRFHGSAMRWWQNGIQGDFDDVTRKPKESREAFYSSLAAAVEASSARFLKHHDSQRSEKSASLARQDWEYAMDHLQYPPSLMDASVAAWSSVELFALTGEKKYADKSVEMGSFIVNSQQREWIEGADHRITGMFFTDTTKRQVFRQGHRGAIHRTSIALKRLCEAFPDHPDWINWYATLAFYTDFYQKATAEFTAPYHFIPQSVYHTSEAGKQQPLEFITNGSDIGGGWYVRKLVKDFNGGHFGVLLAESASLASAAALRSDEKAADLAQQQLQWIIGRNPFSQSCMIGEGYDFPPIYAYSGDYMVGALPVGIKTRPPHDVPFWPTQTCWTYKEVWIHPAYLWLWNLAELADTPLNPKKEEITFTSVQNEDKVTLVAELGETEAHNLELRTYNLQVEDNRKSVSLPADKARKYEWTLPVNSESEPWIAVMIVDNNIDQRYEQSGCIKPVKK